MARTDSLPNFLTDVAGAIRSKTGETGKITASEFDTKINSIELGTAEDVINGIVEEYKVASGGNISTGDFVKYLNETSSGNITNYAIDTTSGGYYAIDAVQLTENKIFIVYGKSKSVIGKVAIISNNNVVFGVATQLFYNNVSGASDIYKVQCVKLTDTKVFVSHTYSSNYSMKGEVCTISSNNTVTVGTVTALDTTYHGGQTMSAVALSSSSVFIAHNHQASSDYPFLYGMLLSISGTTITVKKDSQIGGTYGLGNAVSCCKVTQNNVDRVVVFHTFCKTSTSTENYLYGVVITPTSSSFTNGTDTILDNMTSSTSISSVNIDNSRIIVNRITMGLPFLYVCTVSGTTIKSEGSKAPISLNSGGLSSITKLDDNHIALIHSKSSTNLFYTSICEIDENNNIKSKIDNKMNTQDDSVSLYFSTGKIMVLNNKIVIPNNYISSTGIYLTIYSDYFATMVSKVSSASDSIYGVATKSGTSGQTISVVRPNV